MTTVPKPFIEKARSMGRKSGPSAGRSGTSAASRASSARERVEPLAASRPSTGTIARALEEGALRRVADVLLEQRQPVGAELREEVRLRHRDEAARHAEEAADVEVLAGLRHHALVGGDDEHHEVDAAGARRHRADEPLVAGDVDDAGHGAVGQGEVREPELDGDAAPLLLAQPVGVDAGERLDERGLAVIDVAGGADDDALHARPGAAPGSRRRPRPDRRGRSAGVELVVPAEEDELVGLERAEVRARAAAGGDEHRGADLARARLPGERARLRERRAASAATSSTTSTFLPESVGQLRDRLAAAPRRRGGACSIRTG